MGIGGAKSHSHRVAEELKASEQIKHQQQRKQVHKKQMQGLQANVKQKREQMQELKAKQFYQGGYQQQQLSQSPVRQFMGHGKGPKQEQGPNTARHIGAGSKATTMHSSNQKDFGGQKGMEPGHGNINSHGRFEDSGFLIPVSQESVFVEGSG